MRFSSERELQEHCYRVLLRRGVRADMEVSAGNGRADIVTSDTVYELKLTLDREGLYQALGQGTAYCKALGRSKLVLVGHLPIDPQKRTQAERIAQDIERAGAKVSFVELDNYWQLTGNFYGKNVNHWFNSIVYISILLALACFVMQRGWLKPKEAAILGGVAVLAIESSRKFKS